MSKAVLQTGEAIVIDTFGPEKGKYTNLRARYNQWRLALDREKNPLAKELYSLSIMLKQKPNGDWYAELAFRNSGMIPALDQIKIPELEEPTPPPPPVSQVKAADTISKLFGSDKDE